MLPYFPFDDAAFSMNMRVQALQARPLIEVDMATYHDELALKTSLLTQEYTHYFQAQAGTEALQWETLALLLPEMAREYPQHFTFTINGMRWRWRNNLLADETDFVFGESGSLPLPPLDWLGRQMQEDLLLLDGVEGNGMPLVAGHLCFPNAWCLNDKMGQSFLTIHTPVPLFAEHLARSTSLLLARLKVGRPVWRVNWSIKATARLNSMPRFFYEEEQAWQDFTLENIGERCFLRLERQILARLPRTKGILFTIHTYQAPLSEVVCDAAYLHHARRIAGVVRTMPQEVAHYKSVVAYKELLLKYLDTFHHTEDIRSPLTQL